MQNENELGAIHALLMKKTSFSDNSEGEEEVFFLNEDLENLLNEHKFSDETRNHCRKFLDARKQWGFLYRGLPMDVIDQVGGWGVFSEDLLRMDSNKLDRTLSAYYDVHQIFEEDRQQRLTRELV